MAVPESTVSTCTTTLPAAFPDLTTLTEPVVPSARVRVVGLRRNTPAPPSSSMMVMVAVVLMEDRRGGEDDGETDTTAVKENWNTFKELERPLSWRGMSKVPEVTPSSNVSEIGTVEKSVVAMAGSA